MSNPGIRFSGYLAPFAALDEEHPLFHLIIEEVAAIWPGNKKDVLIDIVEFDTFIDPQTKKLKFEGGKAPKDDLLASFKAVLVHRDDHTFYFDEIEPRNGVDYSQEPEGNIPWFKLKFCVDGTSKDNLDNNSSPEFIIPVLNQENADYEGNTFEIGFSLIDAQDNRKYGNSSSWPALMRVPRHFVPSSYNTSLLYLNSIHSLISEDFLAYTSTPASDATATVITDRTDQQILQNQKRNQQKAAEKALKELEKHIKESGGYYGQYLNKLMEYQELMSLYKSQLDTLDSCKNDEESWHRYQPVVQDTRSKLDKLKTELDEYVFSFGFVPNGIKKAAEENVRKQQRVKEIDEFLNSPMVRVLTLLPYGGTVTGFAKILQGKYLDGMVDLGFALLQYGSIVKLRSLAYQFSRFDSMREKPFMAVRALIASKYAKTMTVGGPNMGTFQKIAEALDPGYENLCKAYNGFTALKNCGNEVRDILKYRSTVQKAILALRDVPSGLPVRAAGQLLKQAGCYGDFLLIVNALKTMNTIRGVPKGVETSLKELEKLGQHANILPDAKECKPATYDLSALLIRFSELDWTTEQVINAPQAFPEADIQKRVQLELKMFAPPHTHANNKDLLISRLNEIIARIEEELPWRKDLYARGMNTKLLERTYGILIKKSEDDVLEYGIAKFCQQLNEMAKYAGYQTWNLEDLIYFQSSLTLVSYGKKYRILTGEGMLEWFREEATAIINLCAI